MKFIREVNGYRLIYKPDHPKAMKSDNWDGYLYEHIYIYEKYSNRILKDDEIIHHLDENRKNNRHENLIALTQGDHMKLHVWLDNSKLNIQTTPKFCKICGLILQDKQINCCSVECSVLYTRIVERPSKEELQYLINSTPYIHIGKKFNVSGNAVKKWAKSYGIFVPKQKPNTSLTKSL